MTGGTYEGINLCQGISPLKEEEREDGSRFGHENM